MKKIIKSLFNLINILKLETLMIKISKMPFLRKKILRCFWEDQGYEYYKKNYLRYQTFIRENGIDLKNKVILEVGSGNSIGMGYFFRKTKFKKWYASDLYRNLEERKIIKEIIRKEGISFKKSVLSKNTTFIKLDITKYEPKYENKFDLILSNAVLEHIPKGLVNQSIKNMFFYLKKGGFMIHEIDLRDHTNLKNTFYFYQYSPSKWEEIVKRSIFYTNMLRAKDYLKLFKANHFELISKKEYLNKHLPKKINPYLLKAYKRKELEVSFIRVVLKKN